MSPVLVLFVLPDKHGEGLLMPRCVQRFYCSTCHWLVSCRKSIYPSIPRTCVLLHRHFFHRVCPISPLWGSSVALDPTQIISRWHVLTIPSLMRLIAEHTNSVESSSPRGEIVLTAVVAGNTKTPRREHPLYTIQDTEVPQLHNYHQGPLPLNCRIVHCKLSYLQSVQQTNNPVPKITEITVVISSIS